MQLHPLHKLVGQSCLPLISYQVRAEVHCDAVASWHYVTLLASLQGTVMKGVMCAAGNGARTA